MPILLRVLEYKLKGFWATCVGRGLRFRRDELEQSIVCRALRLPHAGGVGKRFCFIAAH